MWLLIPAGHCMPSNYFISWPLVLGMEKPAGIIVNELHLHKTGSVQRWLDLKIQYCKDTSICDQAKAYLIQRGINNLDCYENGLPCEALCD